MNDKISQQESKIYKEFFHKMNFNPSFSSQSSSHNYSQVPIFSNIRELAEKYDSFLFDGFGTLYTENIIHPGAAETIKFLREQNKNIRLVTNSASMSQIQMQDFFSKIDIEFDLSEIISSGSLLEIINQELKITEAMYLGRADGIFYLEQSKVSITDNPQEPVVILSSMRESSPKQREQALKVLQRKNSLLIVLNPDVCTPEVNGENRDFASGYAAWQLAQESGCEVIYCGKPFPLIYNQALKSLSKINNFDIKKTIMIGDTLGTDIAGANYQNLDTAVILTGNSTPDNIKSLEQQLQVNPAFYLKNLSVDLDT